jgi:hypothetical protein
MKNHNHTIDSILMIAIALLLAAGFLTSCSQAEEEDTPIACADYDTYKTVATVLIDESAATYAEYMQGNTDYEDAVLNTSMVYMNAYMRLSCDNIEESEDVLTIIRNTRDAIPAGKFSDPAVANMYIDKAYNLINDLNTNWGWEI